MKMALRHGIWRWQAALFWRWGPVRPGRTDPDARRLAGREPDEFGILPTKPLEMPDSLADLPQPQPGGTNRVDPQPRADVARALGGNPARAVAGGGADGGIVNYAGRFGRNAGHSRPACRRRPAIPARQ